MDGREFKLKQEIVVIEQPLAHGGRDTHPKLTASSLLKGDRRMKTLGNLLKQARLDQHFSLEDINQVTKIRPDHLKAIEEGELHKLPGPVYTKGFIMNYARAVGLDEQEILEKYYALTKETVGEEGEDQEVSADAVSAGGAVDQSGNEGFSARRSIKLLQREKKRSFRVGSFVKTLLAALIIAAIIIGILFFFRQTVDSSTAGEQTHEQTLNALEDAEKVGEKDHTDLEISNNSENKEAATKQKVTAKKERPPVLKAEANSTVWIGLYTQDMGKIIYEGTLGPRSDRE